MLVLFQLHFETLMYVKNIINLFVFCACERDMRLLTLGHEMSNFINSPQMYQN